MSIVTVHIDQLQLSVGHYDALPRQIIETLKSKGIPVIGDWMIRGVAYGTLTVICTPNNGMTYIWETDEGFEELI